MPKPPPERQCTHTSKRSGKRCEAWAMKGTGELLSPRRIVAQRHSFHRTGRVGATPGICPAPTSRATRPP